MDGSFVKVLAGFISKSPSPVRLRELFFLSISVGLIVRPQERLSGLLAVLERLRLWCAVSEVARRIDRPLHIGWDDRTSSGEAARFARRSGVVALMVRRLRSCS